MWEFLSRKKEVPVAPAEPIPASVGLSEAVPSAEQVTEQATEKVNEQYAAILSQSVAPQAAPIVADIDSDAVAVSQATDAASVVSQLVGLAQVKGVAHAVEVARKLDDFYILDTMHDELADKLYDGLRAKGLVIGE